MRILSSKIRQQICICVFTEFSGYTRCHGGCKKGGLIIDFRPKSSTGRNLISERLGLARNNLSELFRMPRQL
jgi:hypothetical protein